jgi:hypothetical protein
MSIKSDTQKAFIQEKRNVLLRQIRRWQQVQLVYMPGAAAPSLPTHDDGADEDDTGDSEVAENIPLVLPSELEPARRDTVCLHRVAEYEQELRFAQLQDSLIELRRVRRIRYTLLMNHRTQIAGQGGRPNTRSRTVVNSVDERIAKCTQRYRTAYGALLQLDPAGTWKETYLELKDEDNRGPGKEDDEGPLGDGSYTFSWIWLLNPRARDADGSETAHGEDGASDEEVNEVMQVQWATSQARMERWAEEVQLLQEEMRRVVTFLEWKSENWLEKHDARLATASSSVQSGLCAYARKQATIHHDLAVSFMRLWRPTLVSHNLEHSWDVDYMTKYGISPSSIDVPTAQAQGIRSTRVPNETDGGSSQVGVTQRIQVQDSSNAAVDDNLMMLEEAPYIEDDAEGEGNYLKAWDSLYYFGPDGDDNDNDDNDSDDNDDNNNTDTDDYDDDFDFDQHGF